MTITTRYMTSPWFLITFSEKIGYQKGQTLWYVMFKIISWYLSKVTFSSLQEFEIILQRKYMKIYCKKKTSAKKWMVSQLKVIWINEKNKQITLKVFFSNSVNCHHLTPYRWQRCLKKSYSIIWNLWSN